MFDSMMVAYDGSEISKRALRVGIELAQKLGKPLRTVSVIEDVPIYLSAAAYAPIDGDVLNQVYEQREAYGRQLMEEVRALAAEAGVTVETHAVTGNVIEEIVEAVRDHGCDLLIVGLRAHPGLIDRLVLHTGRTLTERAPCCVMGVK